MKGTMEEIIRSFKGTEFPIRMKLSDKLLAMLMATVLFVGAVVIEYLKYN